MQLQGMLSGLTAITSGASVIDIALTAPRGLMRFAPGRFSMYSLAGNETCNHVQWSWVQSALAQHAMGALGLPRQVLIVLIGRT